MQRFAKCLTTLVVCFAPTLGLAQNNCAGRDHVVGQLAANYGESFAGGGLQSETKIFEVWFSEDQGTWTILMTRADGMTCVMASGTNWREPLPSDQVPQGLPG